ncbi:MAG: NeuD/PglB/VioB family sugar acetyltransferase [Elusimicrobia bacterium]|nr:NeuD/PglB/VioB family sugar acetyltransferase [Elusimicrobiota bacterium]
MRLVICGAGDHAITLYDMAVHVLRHKVVAFTDPRDDWKGKTICGVRVIRSDTQAVFLKRQGRIDGAVIGIGNRQMEARRKVFEILAKQGLKFPALVHPSAVVSRMARVGEGCVVMANAVVNTDAVLGSNVVVNNGAVVDHTCRVGDHTYLSPNATLCGRVEVGRTAFIGAGVTVLPGVRIGGGAVIGAGAVAVRDVEAGQTVVGVPAFPLRRAGRRVWAAKVKDLPR